MKASQDSPLRTNNSFFKIVRSLSDLSQVDTTHLRRAARKQARSRKTNQMHTFSMPDQYLSQEHITLEPEVKVNIQGSPLKKQPTLQEKSIESKVHLARADYELRSMAIQKAKKRVGLNRYPSKKRSRGKSRSEVQVDRSPFYPYASLGGVDLQKQQLNQIKQAISICRMRINTLYSAHQKNLNSLSLKTRQLLQARKAESPQFVNLLMPSLIKTPRKHLPSSRSKAAQQKQDSSDFEGMELLVQSRIGGMKEDEDMPNALPARSIVLTKTTSKKRKQEQLEKLIKLSKKRSGESYEDQGTMLTSKQKREHASNRNLLLTLRDSIEQQNRNKQTIVFGHLKKILYGDRRGKNIKDTTFRTILKGERSSSYMKVVKQQEALLDNFDGSEKNRKELVQRFAGILGEMHKQQLRSERRLVSIAS